MFPINDNDQSVDLVAIAATPLIRRVRVVLEGAAAARRQGDHSIANALEDDAALLLMRVANTDRRVQR